MTSSDNFCECEFLNLTSWQWSFHSNMTRERSQAAGVKVNNAFYMTGGLDADTIEFYDPNIQPFWQYGPNFPKGTRAIFGHCVVPWKDDGFLVIGGANVTSRSTSNSVLHFNTTSQQWTNFPSMNYNRRNHACINVGDKVIVSGGDDGSDARVGYSTEVLDPGATQFRKVGRLLGSRISGKMGAMDGTRVLIIGGYDPVSGKALDTMEEFDFLNDRWSLIDMKLSAPRAAHGLVELPGSICDSLP